MSSSPKCLAVCLGSKNDVVDDQQRSSKTLDLIKARLSNEKKSKDIYWPCLHMRAYQRNEANPLLLLFKIDNDIAKILLIYFT